MEEITTIYALYLLWTSHKRRNIEPPRVWVHNIIRRFTALWISSTTITAASSVTRVAAAS